MSHICRTCVQTVSNVYFNLDGSICGSPTLKIKDVLQTCVPELDLDVVPNPVICENCMCLLYIMHQFKFESLKNEALFLNKQHIRVKNFDALARNEVLTRSQDLENIVVELDNIDDLKTELVYDNEIDEDETTETMFKGLESCIETGNFLNSNENSVSSSGSIEILECPPLLPVNESESTVNDTKEDCNVEEFIQCTTANKKKRNVKRPYKCTECDFCTDTKGGLVMHYRIHTGEKPFHCSKCSYKAKRKSHLEDHLKIHTGERPYVCPICCKCFITKQILKRHMMIHTEEKPYRCLQCNFRSRHKLSIANHIKKAHIGVDKVTVSEPRMCYVCGKWLSGKSSLNSHMKIHTGIKKHLCELCGRYFREKGMLKNHLRTHTGERPFRCTECDYIATRKAHLQEHMRTHVPDRELTQCSICSKRYTTKLLLKKHVNEEHKVSDTSVKNYDLKY